ncbi:hypothetical protein E4U55_001655, partial [Claviceps digitariae]
MSSQASCCIHSRIDEQTTWFMPLHDNLEAHSGPSNKAFWVDGDHCLPRCYDALGWTALGSTTP